MSFKKNEETDVIYYNISIDNTSPQTSGKIYGSSARELNATITANQNIPIIDKPDEYFGSIIRFEVPCFTIPVISFIVQTPIVTEQDINKGIYTFTLKYGSNVSIQSPVYFVPVITDPTYGITPTYPSAVQQFTPYYFIYSYGTWVSFLNTALAVAFADLQTKVSGALDNAKTPFFYYDPNTQLITLYADKDYFDQSLMDPVYIYFNSVSNAYFNGFIWNEENIGDSQGLDNYFVITNTMGLNTKTINSTVYTMNTQEFVALSYLSPLKNILITTQMGVSSEIFFLNSPGATQNTSFVNVLTDFIPDLSGSQEAGVSSKTFIYNATSLYRLFEFIDKNPLYSVSLAINWVDTNNNIYPLQLAKGTLASIKIMFIKKSSIPMFGNIGSTIKTGISKEYNVRQSLNKN